jgi:hypothetical protein
MTTKEVFDTVFETGKKYTIFNIDSYMAMTHKMLITVKATNERGIVFIPKGKRTAYTIPYSGKKYESDIDLVYSHAIFAGWETPITCDTDGGNTMRGNACYNFVGTPEAIRSWIDLKQLNPNFAKSSVIAIEGNKETVVYPEIECSHAVINRKKN